MAGELFLSRSKLYRKIKALTGDTANEFIRKVRLEKAKQLISETEHTISEVCYKVGFSSPSYFTKCFKNHFGILPTEVRESIVLPKSKSDTRIEKVKEEWKGCKIKNIIDWKKCQCFLWYIPVDKF